MCVFAAFTLVLVIMRFTCWKPALEPVNDDRDSMAESLDGKDKVKKNAIN